MRYYKLFGAGILCCMGNKLPPKMRIGTLGEIFVQLRLLEFDIQAAPPIKDSGNDLVAIKGTSIKLLQVKTSLHRTPSPRGKHLPEIYDLIALVRLRLENDKIDLEKSKIWILKKGDLIQEKQELTRSVVEVLWRN